MIGRAGGVRGGDAVGESGRMGTMRVVWRVAALIPIPRFRRCSLDLTLLGRVFLLFCLLHLWPLVVVWSRSMALRINPNLVTDNLRFLIYTFRLSYLLHFPAIRSDETKRNANDIGWEWN